jgi:hypothetical protein
MTLIIQKPTGAKLNLTKTFSWNETVWNPSMITTALWLDAADASTITESGGAVSQWDDKSGNNYHVSQATAADQPTVSTDAGNASISFDGTSDYLRHDVSGTFTYPSSIFIVCRNTDTANAGHALSMNNSFVSDEYATLTQRNFSGQAILYNVRDVSSSFISVFSTFGTEIVNAVSNASNNNELFSNGASVGTETSTWTTPSYDNISIGRLRYQVSGQYFVGHVHEIIWIRQSLDLTTRQKIEGYLAHKWGLTANLPSDHPYKLVGPTP